MSFRDFLFNEFRELRRYSILFACLIIIMACITIFGNVKYLNTQKEIKTFIETERLKVEDYTTYTQYGTFGIRLKLILPLISIFNSSRMADIQARIDAGERLVLYRNNKGIDLFKPFDNFIDFSGLTLLIIGFIAMYYGLNSFMNREGLKRLLSCVPKQQNLLFWMIGVRTVFVILGYMTLLVVSLIISALFHNYISISQVFRQALPAVCALIFFVTLGIYISLGKSKRKFPRFFVVFFLIVFLLPWGKSIADEIISSNLKTNSKLELENLSFVMDFERYFLKKHGVFKSGSGEVAPEDIRKSIEGYVRVILKNIIDNEKALISGIRKKSGIVHFLSSLFPTTFYHTNSKEGSGVGLYAIIDFHNYATKIKKAFTKWYLEKKYFEKTPPGEVTSFIKKDENLFSPTQRAPVYFWTGAIFSLIWISIFIMASFRRFIKVIDFISDIEFEKKINHLPGKGTYFLTNNPVFENAAFYQYLSRNILLNGQIAEYDFIYLPRPSNGGNQGFIQWKNDFYHALKSSRLILTTGLDEIRIHEINNPSPVITINEIEAELKRSEGFMGAIGNDYYLFKKTGDNGYCHPEDESIHLNCLLPLP